MASSLARLLAPLALLALLCTPTFAQPASPTSTFPGLPTSELPEIPAAPATLEIPEIFEIDYGHNVRVTGTPEYLAENLRDALGGSTPGSERTSS